MIRKEKIYEIVEKVYKTIKMPNFWTYLKKTEAIFDFTETDDIEQGMSSSSNLNMKSTDNREILSRDFA